MDSHIQFPPPSAENRAATTWNPLTRPAGIFPGQRTIIGTRRSLVEMLLWKKSGSTPSDFFGAVSPVKKIDHVVGQAEFLQLVQQLPNVAVEPRDDGGLVFFRLRPRLFGKRRIGRHLDLSRRAACV